MGVIAKRLSTPPPPTRTPVRSITETGIEARFHNFHHDNPHVYVELVRLARQARARGHLKIGIKMLWEVMRWNFKMQTTDTTSDFKLSNDYHSRYARLIMKQEKDLDGLFELRELRGD